MAGLTSELPIDRMALDATRTLKLHQQGEYDNNSADLACHVLALIEENGELREAMARAVRFAVTAMKAGGTPEDSAVLNVAAYTGVPAADVKELAFKL